MWNTLKQGIWRWTLKRLRAMVWTADEWIHAQELLLRDAAPRPVAHETTDEFNVKASAAREKTHKRAARAARPRQPRLRYAAGAWVRE